MHSSDLLTTQSDVFTPTTLLQANGSKIITSASGMIGCLDSVGVVSGLAYNLCSVDQLVTGNKEWRLDENGAYLIDRTRGIILIKGPYIPMQGLNSGIWILPYQ